MGILFLLAVLFAIPTFGLSLLAYFGLFIVKNYNIGHQARLRDEAAGADSRSENSVDISGTRSDDQLFKDLFNRDLGDKESMSDDNTALDSSGTDKPDSLLGAGEVTDCFQLHEYVIESANAGQKPVQLQPISDKTVAQYYEVFSIGISIPLKTARNSLGATRCGYIDVPGDGTRCVFMAHFGSRLVIVGSELITNTSLLLWEPEKMLVVQNEFFRRYWNYEEAETTK